MRKIKFFSSSLLLLGMLKLVAIAFPAYNSSAINTCSSLGSFNSTANKCQCEAGWVGPTCAQPDLLAKTETPESYLTGVYDPAYPTWGGSIIESDLRGNDCASSIPRNRKYYWLGSTMGNSAGLSCWTFTSGCAIWEASDPKGPWTFQAWVGWGDYVPSNSRQTGQKMVANEIPWCHNFRAVIESKLSDPSNPQSQKTFAVAAYAILKQDKKSGRYANSNLNQPSAQICQGYVYPFPNKTQSKILHVAHREIALDTSCKSEQYQLASGIRNILESRALVPNVNQSARNEYVNTELSWLNLRPLIPNLKAYSPENPSPMVSNLTNQSSLVMYKGNSIRPSTPTIQNGQYYRPLSFRVLTKGEHIGILAVRADHFIWDAGVKYYMTPLVGAANWDVEDPFFFETKNGYHFLAHDQVQCGKDKLTCGSSLHLSKQANDILDSGTAKQWTQSGTIYTQWISGLSDPAVWRQRPYLWFNNNTADPNYGAPGVFFAGTIWSGFFDSVAGAWVSKHGATKNFAIPTSTEEQNF
jgi:hypothetical protein